MSEKFYEKFTEKKSAKSGKSVKKETTSKNKFPDKKPVSKNRTDKANKFEVRTSAKKNPAADAKNNSAQYTVINSQFSITKLCDDSQYVLTNFDEVVQGVKPLNSKQLQQLPDNIRDLSHQLTDDRASRRLGYMNENVQLSAYVRYYTWWNLIRLTRLFSNLSENAFPQKDGVCLDLGSGPLTVVTALWLARPELRKLKLTWYCLDVSSNSMALGEDVYLSVVARSGEDPWKVIRVKGSFGTSLKQRADFITCANMFNELDQASDMPPEYQTKKYFDQLRNYASKDCKYILIEPGVPKASRTLSLLRERFIKAGNNVIAPCPHEENCPMNGFKAYTGSQNKWCNFAFSTENAPKKLQNLSEKAKLPKERATLSFIAIVPVNKTSAENAEEGQQVLIRIASDPFRMPENKTGYYGCSKLGLTLVTVNKRFDMENPEENNILSSGDLIEVKIKTPDFSKLPRDEKSGAVKIDL